MVSNKPRALGDVLQELIDRLGLREGLENSRAVEAWAEVAGPQINAVTQSVWMDRGKLFVKVTSAAWRQELHLSRRAWKDRVNTHLGTPTIKEIIFR